VKVQLETCQPELGPGQTEAMLRRWFVEDKGQTEVRKLLLLVFASPNLYSLFK
jgi:hypothetical protein